MKILLDQNISYRIVSLLKPTFAECDHVNDVNLNNRSDKEIWEFAKSNDYVIVTFDADFYELALLNGIPPKIIWLRIGNASTLTISHFLLQNKELILEFGNTENKNICLEIG